MNYPEIKSKTRTSRLLSFSAWLFAALAVFLAFSVNFQFSQSASSVQGQGTPRFLAKWIIGGAPPPPQCSDGIDNDSDDAIDFTGGAGKPRDPGCSGPNDDDERDSGPPPQCSDGIDNDSDDKIDFTGGAGKPRDPGCSNANDNDERDSKPPPGFCEADPATGKCPNKPAN